MRAQFEDAARQGGGLSEGKPVRVTKAILGDVLICESRQVARQAQGPAGPSGRVLAGRAMDLIFGLVAGGEPVPPDPVGASLRLAKLAGEPTLVAGWEALSPVERHEASEIVEACSATLARHWPRLPDSALMRIQEPLAVELARGRVVLNGRVDLVVGAPSAGRAGATLVDIKSGQRRHDDSLDAGWYAVLETLRHRTPPFQVGTYYLRDGALDLAVADEEFLERAAARVADGIERMVRLGAGKSPDATPNGLCRWCPALDGCPAGREHVEETGTVLGAGPGGSDEEDYAQGGAP